ncbi:MAG: SIS domain-containing protein [Candidatus Woesearchaeota archaeon]
MQSTNQDFPQDYTQYDSQNYEQYIKGYSEDLRTSYNRSLKTITNTLKFDGKIIITGSSWSLNAAKITTDYLKKQINIMYAQSFDETIQLTEKDILIAISYSGNSEEAATWLKYARRTGTQIIIITAGEKLQEETYGGKIIDLTKNLPSRCSTFTIIGTLLRLFEDANLIEKQIDEVQKTVNYIREQNIKQITQEISQKILGKIPLIYATTPIKNAAHKLKRLINANAKTTAFFNEIPGAEYYELEGYKTKNAQFHAIIISSTQDLSRLRKKTTILKNNLQNQGIDVTELNIKAENLVKQATTILLGEYISYYLALRYKQDPLNDEITQKIKKETGIFI